MIINLTPHVIDVYGSDAPGIVADTDRPYLSIAPSGEVARIAEAVLGDGKPTRREGAEAVEVFTVEYGHVTGLPDMRFGVWLVVSLPLALAVHGRPDLLVPWRQVRNGRGTVVGCRGFARPV